VNGSEWKTVAAVKNGSVEGEVPAGAKALRLLITADQTNWLILHEIIIE
jgi:hypothetical protein